MYSANSAMFLYVIWQILFGFTTCLNLQQAAFRESNSESISTVQEDEGMEALN